MMIYVFINYVVFKRIYLYLFKLGEYLKKIFIIDYWFIEYIFILFVFLCFFFDSLDISLS